MEGRGLTQGFHASPDQGAGLRTFMRFRGDRGAWRVGSDDVAAGFSRSGTTGLGHVKPGFN